MELLTITQIYEKYPSIEDISNRLEISKKLAEQTYKQRKETKTINSEDSLDKKTSRLIKVAYEHARVYQYYSNGSWHETHHLLQPGKEVFEQNLMRIMARKPDAIKIQLNNSSKLTSISKPQIIEIVFNKDVEIQQQKPIDQESETVNKIQEKLNGLEAAIKNQPVVTANNVGESLDKLNFASELKDIQHTNTIENLKRDHRYEKDVMAREYEKQIDELQETIEDLEAEIEDLEAEKADTEENLSGIETTIAKAKNPPLFEMLGKIGANIVENLVKENVSGVSKFLKVDEKELKNYFLGKEEEENKSKQIQQGNESTFTEAKTVIENEMYSNLNTEKKEIADNFINVVEMVSVEDLKLLINILNKSLNEDGTINIPVYGEMIKKGIEVKEQQSKAKETI